MQKRLLIIDGQSDSDGPNCTIEDATKVVGHLFGEIQRLEFRDAKQLIADLPKYQADRVITAGHGGRDGPNAREGLNISGSLVVTEQSISVSYVHQDQLATTEERTMVVEGPTLLADFNVEARDWGVAPLTVGEHTNRTDHRDVGFVLEVVVEKENSTAKSVVDEFSEPTSNTDNLPAFGEFCQALASCVGSPVEQRGHVLEPYVYFGSCYSLDAWDGVADGENPEPTSFAHAVAGMSGVPTFGNAHGTSISATLENIKRIERAVDASPTGKVPNNAKLQDGVKLVR